MRLKKLLLWIILLGALTALLLVAYDNSQHLTYDSNRPATAPTDPEQQKEFYYKMCVTTKWQNAASVDTTAPAPSAVAYGQIEADCHFMWYGN